MKPSNYRFNVEFNGMRGSDYRCSIWDVQLFGKTKKADKKLRTTINAAQFIQDTIGYKVMDSSAIGVAIISNDDSKTGLAVVKEYILAMIQMGFEFCPHWIYETASPYKTAEEHAEQFPYIQYVSLETQFEDLEYTDHDQYMREWLAQIQFRNNF